MNDACEVIERKLLIENEERKRRKEALFRRIMTGGKNYWPK